MTDTPTPTPTERQAIDAMVLDPTSAERSAVDAMFGREELEAEGQPIINSRDYLLVLLREIPGSVHARLAIDKGALVEDHWELCNKNQRPNASPAECDCGWAGRYRLASEDETRPNRNPLGETCGCGTPGCDTYHGADR